MFKSYSRYCNFFVHWHLVVAPSLTLTVSVKSGCQKNIACTMKLRIKMTFALHQQLWNVVLFRSNSLFYYSLVLCMLCMISEPYLELELTQLDALHIIRLPGTDIYIKYLVFLPLAYQGMSVLLV